MQIEHKFKAAVKAANEEREARLKVFKEISQKIAKIQPMEPTADGYYELSPVMSKALETELQKIMIEVWQALPDSPHTETEKIVAEKLRTDVGDDLKNALGLNVSKRILKVTNPLYVKIEFDRKPFGVSIQDFVRWLNCAAMKRVLDGQHNYVALIQKQADFDRVINKHIMRIGGLTAKITPFYKFIKCPLRLRTPYTVSKKVEVEERMDVDEQKQNTDNNKEETSIICEASDKKTPEVVTAAKKTAPIPKPAPVSKATPIPKPAQVLKQAPVSKPAEVAKSAPVSKPGQVAKPAQIPKSAPVSKPGLVAKPAQVAKSAPVSKPVPAPNPAQVSNAAPVSKPAEVPKPAPVSNPAQVSKPTQVPKQAAVPKQTAVSNAVQTPKQTQISKPAPTSKPAPASKPAPVLKPAQVTKTENTKVADIPAIKKVEPAKPPIAGGDAAKPKDETTPNKNTTKKAPQATPKNTEKVQVTKPVNKKLKQPVAKVTPIKNDKKRQRKSSDFDELDDEDILALMSNAIVLDECAGSDED